MKLPDVATQRVLAIAALVCCLQLAAAAELGNQTEHYIYGGDYAKKGAFPWQVLLRIGDGYCGGSIISDSWVMTAAHCTPRGKPMKLQFGSLRFDGQDAVVQTSRVFIQHERFDESAITGQQIVMHDIALIKLSSPLKWTDTIKPVKLPRRSQQNIEGQMISTSGWGGTTEPNLSDTPSPSPRLKYLNAKVGADRACRDRFVLCTQWYNDRSMYRGDSGGAIVWRDPSGAARQVSINSQFHVEKTDESKKFRFSGASVAHYLDWIAAKTGISVED